MAFLQEVEKQLQEAEERHEKGNHEGAVSKIKDIRDKILQEGQPPDRAGALCLWGYCLEDLEYYFTARKAYIAALMSLLGELLNIGDLIDGEEQERTRREEEQWKRGEEEWRERDKTNATIYFHTLRNLDINAGENREKLVKAAKVFSALGDLAFKEKRFDEDKCQYNRAKELCESIITKVVANNNVEAEAHYRMGYVLMKLTDYKGSKANYEKAIDLYLYRIHEGKKLAKAYNSLGNLYRCEGYLEDAKLGYEKAVEVDKSFTPAMNNLAYTLYELGEYKKAKEWCDKAIGLEEESAEFYDTLGCVYARLRMFEESKKFFEKALTKKKRDAFIYNNYGEMLRVAGAYEEAKMQLKKALGLDESFALAHSNLGDLYREQGDLLYGKEEKQKKYKEAEGYYTTANSKDSHLPDARFGLANLYVSQTEAEAEKDEKSKPFHKKALGQMKIISRSYPNWVKRRPSFYLLRGYIYGKLDEPYKAKIDFKRCRRLSREDDEISSKAEDNLDALRAVELDKRMMWGGIGLSILAFLAFIALTVLYLYPFSKGGPGETSVETATTKTLEPKETTKTTETKDANVTTKVTEMTKETKEITETRETKKTEGTGKDKDKDKDKDEHKLVNDTTYQIVAPFCLAFIALGVSLPFVTKVQLKELTFDKTSIAGMSSKLDLVR